MVAELPQIARLCAGADLSCVIHELLCFFCERPFVIDAALEQSLERLFAIGSVESTAAEWLRARIDQSECVASLLSNRVFPPD